MGFFSWKTSDTGESIPNIFSNRKPFTVHMITSDGRVFTEHNYEGYGVFGGKDYYTLLGEINGITGKDENEIRTKAISLFYKNKGNDNQPNLKPPKLVQNLPMVQTIEEYYELLPCSESCEYQGYFYDDFYDEYF